MIELIQQEQDEVKAGRKISAIKLLRERLSCGLYDAKQAVDAWCDAQPKDYEKLYNSALTEKEAQRQVIVDLYEKVQRLEDAANDREHDRSYDKGCLERANLDAHHLRGQLAAYREVVQTLSGKPAFHTED